MAATHLIAARVSTEMKASFRTAAERQQLTESALLKRLLDLTIRSVDACEVESAQRRLRSSRVCIRLHPNDQLLLRERAAARQLPAATYVSVLVRAHLRSLSPLPKEELRALKGAIAELGAVGRNLNQIAKAANQADRHAAPGREDVRAMLRICEALREHVKAVVKANNRTWEVGHAQSDR
jgi:Bacterial mobilisation protein (MobC)